MCTQKGDLEQAQSRANTWHNRRPSDRSRTPRVYEGHSRLAYQLLSSAFFAFLLSACPLYNPAAFIQHQTGPKNILSTAAQLTIEWDAPASGSPQVVSYTFSYRTHGTSTWTTLATVPASAQPAYTLLHSAIGSGSFDFAVAAVSSTGATSPLETSLSPTADPSSVWYLTW